MSYIGKSNMGLLRGENKNSESDAPISQFPFMLRSSLTGKILVDKDGVITPDGFIVLEGNLTRLKDVGEACLVIKKETARGVKMLILGIPKSQCEEAYGDKRYNDAYHSLLDYLDDVCEEVSVPRIVTGKIAERVLEGLRTIM